MLMVPLYAVASFISLFSLEAAFFIDVVRDIYEVSRTSLGLVIGARRGAVCNTRASSGIAQGAGIV